MISSELLKAMLFGNCILFFLPLVTNAQEPEQDCSGAIVVTSSPDTFSYYESSGAINELQFQQNNSCLIGGEENSVWITFTVCDTGILLFQISPSGPGDDFDWALYDFTNFTCANVFDLSNELRCNYSAIPGPTGLDTQYTATSTGAGGPNQCAELHSYINQRLLLVVNNHAQTFTGFELTFSGNAPLCPAVGIPQVTKDRFVLYPNPTNGTLELRNLPAENLEIEIINVYGNKVYTTELNTPDGNQLHLPPILPDGFYVLAILEHGKPIAKESFILSR